MDGGQTLVNVATVLVSGILVVWSQSRVRDQLQISSNLEDKRSDRNIKRDAYSSFIGSIEEVFEAIETKDKKRRIEAERAMNSALSIIDLIAPRSVYWVASDVNEIVDLPRSSKRRDKFLDEIYTAMRIDLGTQEPKYDLKPAKKK